MPTFDDQQVDVSGVSDRRGRRGVAVAGGGLSVAGVIVYLLLQVLGGGSVDPSFLQVPADTEIAGTGESLEDLQRRCNTNGAIDRYDDCYLIKVSNEIDEVWSEHLDGYERPTLTFYEQGVQTGCGPASSEVGPFYCPADRSVYIDLGFLAALQDRFGAQGRYAQAYILAHEVGHHLQTLLGTERKVRAEQQRNPGRANELSVRMELQADCYSGVWGRLADDAGKVAITEAELDEALKAAAAVGDDRIQRKTQGRVDPESWTHGSAEQRRTWFRTGFRNPRLGSCDTF